MSGPEVVGTKQSESPTPQQTAIRWQCCRTVALHLARGEYLRAADVVRAACRQEAELLRGRDMLDCPICDLDPHQCGASDGGMNNFTRLEGVLAGHGITTIGDLVVLSDVELLSHRNISQRTLEILDGALRSVGLERVR